MKQKNLFILFIISIFVSLYTTINIFAYPIEVYNLLPLLQQTIEQNTHTMTLQFTEPSKLGDKYSWLITSEAGQLAPSLCLFTSQPPNSKIYGEDTEIILVQNAIDLNKICETFHLNYQTYNNPLTVTEPITVNYYYQSNVKNAYPVILFPYHTILLEQSPIKKALDMIKIYIETQK
ncbi:hypothetical protein [Clostridium sp. MD294]|uniref:hypothetical protein n=1 Tax=Clostridium sp. MD294 TaxID=97138 RepID=UPI0002C920CA|nr:hypothetical protein [Clostridium sp. MD294]NDO47332.1 hypothetical protein [Clostridium sp. MD294]USF29600.1 hypothetical protein C820_001000 [Clostridium sp. MD294]